MSTAFVPALAVVLGAACHQTPRPAEPLEARVEAPPSHVAKAPVEEPEIDWIPQTRRGRTVVTSTSIQILDQIEFVAGTAILDPKSYPMLDAIASTMTGNPSIQLMEVRAFGNDVAPQWQLVIGSQRANRVIDYIVTKGVDRSRLRPQGIPFSPKGTDGRPAFLIVSRGP